MRYLNVALNAMCDLLLSPFRLENPWPGLIGVSCVTAALFVWVFRSFSDQRALKRLKGRMFARALELLLYRHDMVVSVTAFPRIAAANLNYLAKLFKPVAVAAIPSILLLIQLADWFEYRPFAIGESVLVSVDFSATTPILRQHVELAASDGLVAETDGMRIPSLNQVNWRLRALAEGPQSVEVVAGDVVAQKAIIVGDRLSRVSRQRVRSGFWSELLHPGEVPLPVEGAVERISVHYPKRLMSVAGGSVSWLISFLVLVMAFGLIFGRLLRVSF